MGCGMHIAISEERDEDLVRFIRDQLSDSNLAAVGYGDSRDLTITARDEEGNLTAVLVATTRWDWLHVEYLWVAAASRGQGLGQILLARAEGSARERGCYGAYATTFSFQAPDFYSKQGYELFGELENLAGRHRHCFFKKRFATN